MKVHEQIGEALLRARRVVHSCRAMFTRTSLDKLKDSVEASQYRDKRESWVKPFNAFLQDQKEQIHQHLQAEGLDSREIKKSFIKHAWSLWGRMTALEQASYATKAHDMTARNIRKASAADRDQRDELVSALQEKADHEEKLGLPNHVAACKYTESDFDIMAAICVDMDGPTLSRTEDTKFHAPPPLPDEEIDLLEEHAKSMMEPTPDKPYWLDRVCVHRDTFDGTAFIFTTHPGSAWIFLYASQNPRWAVFLRVERREVVLPALEDMTLLEIMDQSCGHMYEFDYSNPFAFDSHETLPFDNVEDVQILQGVRFRRDGVVVDRAPLPF